MKTTMNKSGAKEGTGGASPSQLIGASIKALGDWRGETLARIRALIQQADPEVVEEWQWGIPVWSHDGIICTGETYKKYVKTTFARGAALADPSGLFNSSLKGGTRRAIDFREGGKIDEKAFKVLVRAAVALNTSQETAARPVRSPKKPKEEIAALFPVTAIAPAIPPLTAQRRHRLRYSPSRLALWWGGSCS